MKNEKNIEKIVKLADKINDLMEWQDDEERRDFYSACGLLPPEEEGSNLTNTY